MTERTDLDVQEQVIPGVTPGNLLKAMESPDDFAAVARGDLYVQMAKMRHLASNPELSFTARMDYVKFLAKMGRVDAPQADTNPLAGLPSIQIVLPNSGNSVNVMAAAPPAEKEVGPSAQKPSAAVIP